MLFPGESVRRMDAPAGGMAISTLVMPPVPALEEQTEPNVGQGCAWGRVFACIFAATLSQKFVYTSVLARSMPPRLLHHGRPVQTSRRLCGLRVRRVLPVIRAALHCVPPLPQP